MHNRDRVYITHMLDTARNIFIRTQALERHDYDADETLRLALIHLVQMLGEAARIGSIQTQQQYPDIAWREIIGMRHKLVHDYLYVDDTIVWTVVKHDVPLLIAQLEQIILPED